MSSLSLSLVLVAAVLHAGWNVLAKRGRDPFLFLWLSVGLASLVFVPTLVLAARAGELSRATWPYLAGSGSIHACYFFALGQSYRYGDFSRAYPIVRGLGVALVPVLALLFLGEQLTPVGWLGVSAVVVGIVAIGRKPGEPMGLRFGRGTAWALVTGLCVAGYSTVDKAGVATMDPLPYICILGLLSTALSTPFVLARRRGLRDEWRLNRRNILIAATLNLTAYLWVLYAFQLSKAGYVVAAREVSIVLSAVIGSVWLREGRLRSRLVGATIILAGVVCVALAE